MADAGDFEILAPPTLSLFCFRFRPPRVTDPAELDRLNQTLLERLNASGALYLTHTRIRDAYAIRFCIGQAGTAQRHVDAAWRRIRDTARALPGR
jgi:aromatic-L-amino-acid decarboxylase